MKKKLATWLVCTAMAVSLTACGGSGKTADSAASSAVSEAASSGSEAESAAVSESEEAESAAASESEEAESAAVSESEETESAAASESEEAESAAASESEEAESAAASESEEAGSAAASEGTEAAAGTASERAAANEIVIGIAQDLDSTLDPHYAVAAGTREVMFNVFEGLVKPTSEGDLVPAVASDYTISDDGLTYTFTLRDGILFHSGEPVKTSDVVWSIERNADTSEGEPLIPAFASIEEITSDDTTVTIKLSEPNNEFLSYMTVAVLPESYDKQDTDPVGTGPFRFVSRVAQDSIVLERFEDYWGEPAHMDRVTYKVNEKMEGLIMGLQSGALDLVSHMSSTDTAQLDPAEFNIEEGTMNLVQALYLNNSVEPFDNELVRQALCYAIDRQGILDMAFDGYGSLIGSAMYPAFGKYFDESLTEYYTYDPEKAMELLAEAGYPNGFEMTITVPSNYQPHVNTGEVIAEQLSAVGITATLEPVEWATWLSDVYAGGKYQSTVIGLTANDMTARALLERFNSAAADNFIYYKNDDYDKLYKEAITTYDDEAQTAIYKDMEKNLTEHAASVFIQDMADMVAVRKGLSGLQFYPLYVLDVSTLQWDS